MREIFQAWQTSRLRGHLVWIPMLETDTLDAARAQEALFQDERLIQYWDGRHTLGRLVAQSMKLAAPIAWDIYLLYSPGAVWRGAVFPPPEFWMHQLDERPDLLLDPSRLKARVEEAVEAALV